MSEVLGARWWLLAVGAGACAQEGGCSGGSPEAVGHSGAFSTPTVSTVGGVPRIFINEIVPTNGAGLQDQFGERPDWVELYNPQNEPVDLAGWWITDDKEDPFNWQFEESPALVIPAGGYLVLFLQGDPDESLGTLHVDFGLKGDVGDFEDVALYGPNVKDNPLVDLRELQFVPTDASDARASDGAFDWVLDPTPTPGAPNDGE